MLLYKGEFMKYFVCQYGLDAIVRYENDDFEEEDRRNDTIHKRYNLNIYINYISGVINMIELFILLVLAHLAADYVFQTDFIALGKNNTQSI
jgi:uncharacterized membrane protein